MDYDADSAASGGANTLRFPSTGYGAVTEDLGASAWVRGKTVEITHITVIDIAAVADQVIQIRDAGDSKTFLALTSLTTDAAGDIYVPNRQFNAASNVSFANAADTTLQVEPGLDCEAGFGIKVAAAGSNTLKFRVWYRFVSDA